MFNVVVVVVVGVVLSVLSRFLRSSWFKAFLRQVFRLPSRFRRIRETIPYGDPQVMVALTSK